MKPVNLKHVIIANNSLSVAQRDALYQVWGIKPKRDELLSLDDFVKKCISLSKYDPESITKMLGDCYFGFSIPRISKEFDCLWIGERTIVNIELKSQNVGEDRIRKQLVQNKYYLQHLQKQTFSFTYDSSTGSCYSLDKDEKLHAVGFNDVVQAICDIHGEVLFEDHIESLFPPERFLVSPYNSTEDFLNGCYFLTSQQQEFKNEILAFVDDAKKGNFCALTGGPGSGKTLLLYDIAHSLMESGKNVVIGHSGGLNNGHRFLISNGWRIKSTKNLFNFNYNTGKYDIVDADVYLIDEAQRCFNYARIVDEVSKNGKKCVLSFDASQIMSRDEKNRDNATKIQSLVGKNCYTLSSNIRTNDDVYEFVKALFDKRSSVNRDIHDHVEITYCQAIGEAVAMLEVLKNKGYNVPKFTPKLHGCEEYESWFPAGEMSAHEVIGQEFDNVAGLISDKMYYDGNNKLVSSNVGYLYFEGRMLYQILTRARHKIHLVIVNNPVILERCIKLING